MHIIRIVVAALFFLWFASGKAVEPAYSDRLGDILPHTGTYIDWATAGVSLEFDIGPNGSSYGTFMLFHTYDADGSQINWIGQPEYRPTTEQDRMATGVIGRASGDLYYATNGPCIGCAPRNPVITYPGIHFEAEWIAPRTLTLKLSGARTGAFNLTAVNYASAADTSLLEGTWAATVTVDWARSLFQPTDRVIAWMAVLNLKPIQATFALDPGAPAGTKLPPVSAQAFSVTCAPDERGNNGSNQVACSGFFVHMGYGPKPENGYLVAWYDPVSKRAGMEAAKFVTGAYILGAKVGTMNLNKTVRHDLYIDPGVVRGRGKLLSEQADMAITSLVMAKLPDGTVRSQYDYQPPTP